jgi:hypothetical protein
MNKLQRWALGAEVISGIAVVVTLIFLVVEMRENTNAIQAQTYQELMRDINRWRSSIRDLEREGLFVRIAEQGSEGVSEGEYLEVRLVFLELWGIYETAFFANERGILGPAEWARFDFMICRERTSISGEYFASEVRGLPSFEATLTPTFSEYVRDHCK